MKAIATTLMTSVLLASFAASALPSAAKGRGAGHEVGRSEVVKNAGERAIVDQVARLTAKVRLSGDVAAGLESKLVRISREELEMGKAVLNEGGATRTKASMSEVVTNVLKTFENGKTADGVNITADQMNTVLRFISKADSATGKKSDAMSHEESVLNKQMISLSKMEEFTADQLAGFLKVADKTVSIMAASDGAFTISTAFRKAMDEIYGAELSAKKQQETLGCRI